MSGRAMSSPGGALLRSSRMFSVPKPLPEPQSNSFNIGDHKSPTMTRPYPQHQVITSPMSSRENGDWGFKRPFPLKSTMTTSTPLIRIKQVDAIENVTDFASASDLTLSLEKFQEMRIAPVLPRHKDSQGRSDDTNFKSVFEEDMDVTDWQRGKGLDKKWKFQGPWLARMDEGSFVNYLDKKVRPKRTQFRVLLRNRMADDINHAKATQALELGQAAPEKITPKDITEAEFTEYMRTLRGDRATLYHIVSGFLDLAPLTTPVGIVNALLKGGENTGSESPYGKTGAPQSHPSAGIGYLRTNSIIENHPVYGPQARRTPVRARMLAPRQGLEPAKLGVGGFVANVPPGDNAFNARARGRSMNNRDALNGVTHLDITTFGGAKAFIEPAGAIIDPSGKVVLQLKEAGNEARLVDMEKTRPGLIYNEKNTKGAAQKESDNTEVSPQRMSRLADEMMADNGSGREAGSRNATTTPRYYGLDR